MGPTDGDGVSFVSLRDQIGGSHRAACSSAQRLAVPVPGLVDDAVAIEKRSRREDKRSEVC